MAADRHELMMPQRQRIMRPSIARIDKQLDPSRYPADVQCTTVPISQTRPSLRSRKILLGSGLSANFTKLKGLATAQFPSHLE